MSFLKVDFMRDLIAVTDALCAKYGVNGSADIGTPNDSDQSGELTRLRGIFSEKVAGIIGSSTEVDNSDTTEETNESGND